MANESGQVPERATLPGKAKTRVLLLVIAAELDAMRRNVPLVNGFENVLGVLNPLMQVLEEGSVDDDDPQGDGKPPRDQD